MLFSVMIRVWLFNLSFYEIYIKHSKEKVMARLVKIATTSLATLEDIAPPYNLRHPDPEDNLKLGLSLLEAAGEQGVDLVCLPEGFMAAGLAGPQIKAI